MLFIKINKNKCDARDDTQKNDGDDVSHSVVVVVITARFRGWWVGWGSTKRI